MAKALPKKTIDISNGPKPLYDYLKLYKAQYYNESSTDKGQVFWSPPPVNNWMLVMKKGNNVFVTFYPADDCPCSKI